MSNEFNCVKKLEVEIQDLRNSLGIAYTALKACSEIKNEQGDIAKKAIRNIENEYFSENELYFMANPEEVVEYEY